MQNLDLNKIFFYKTKKQIVIQDKKLGLFYLSLCFLLTFYVIYALIIKSNGIFVIKQSKGYVFPEIQGKLYSQTQKKILSFSDADIVHPILQNQELFVATRIYRVPRQQITFCGKTCKDNTDCFQDLPTKEGICEQGSCKEINWCPLFDPKIYTAQNLTNHKNLMVYMLSLIEFQDNNIVFKSTNTKDIIQYPSSNYNTYSVKQLIEFSGKRFDELYQQGGVFNVEVNWDCYYRDSGCSPNLKVFFVNTSQYYEPTKEVLNKYVEKVIYFKNKNEKTRDLYIMIGFQFIFNSKGICREFNFFKLLMFLGIIALSCMSMKKISDWVMLTLYPTRLQKQYLNAKYIKSDDFSDLKEGLNPVKKERELQIKKKDQ